MKKRIVSLLCAGLLVFSEPYPTPAAQSAGTEAITDHSEEVPCADDSGSGDESRISQEQPFFNLCTRRKIERAAVW